MTVRPAAPDDVATVVALNEADRPHLSGLTLSKLERLAGLASYFRVAEHEGKVAGFLLAIPSAAEHEGTNFLWFKSRYTEAFLYIDRVVVAASARRAGIASRLYRDLEANAGVSLVTCEINLRPPNPDSIAFHDRHGFLEVGTQDTENGAKTVSMRVKRRTTVVDRRP